MIQHNVSDFASHGVFPSLLFVTIDFGSLSSLIPDLYLLLSYLMYPSGIHLFTSFSAQYPRLYDPSEFGGFLLHMTMFLLPRVSRANHLPNSGIGYIMQRIPISTATLKVSVSSSLTQYPMPGRKSVRFLTWQICRFTQPGMHTVYHNVNRRQPQRSSLAKRTHP
jgi:hypothetical protein